MTRPRVVPTPAAPAAEQPPARESTRFAVATVNGTRYLFDGERLLISDRWEQPRVIHPTKITVVERAAVDYAAFDRAATRARAEAAFWQHIEELPWNDRPEVGALLYAEGGDEWVLSTPVTFAYFVDETTPQPWMSRPAIRAASASRPTDPPNEENP